MPSLKTSVAVVAAALFAAGSQAQIQYSIDPTTVALAIRSQWCTSQKAACPLLCLQLPGNSATTKANNCDPGSLTYQCVCGNGQQPNASEFSQTLPFFICQQYGNACVAACNGEPNCQNACRVNHPCGAQDPSPPNSSALATIASTTIDASEATGVVHTGLGGAAAATTPASGKKSGGQAALNMGQSYGLAVVFTGVFAGFALML